MSEKNIEKLSIALNVIYAKKEEKICPAYVLKKTNQSVQNKLFF